MTTTRRHGETAAPAKGLDARMEDIFGWLASRSREVLIGLGAFLVIGGGLAVTYEYGKAQERKAQDAFASVERAYLQDMGATPGSALVVEPANPDRARQARETALAGLEAVIGEHRGTAAAWAASIRAAEMEADLGQLEAAETRLAALEGALDVDAGFRGIALRLQGYVLEELGREEEGAEVYAMAGSVVEYGDRAGVWLVAARTFERVGDPERAIAAYQEVISLDPRLADRNGVASRLDLLAAETVARAE